ncbi:MAG: hypothetical protein K2X68_15085 [Novosphingobium sp.]|nr:hypothetical protein [Novosphingobium sp.]
MSTASKEPSIMPTDWPGRRADFADFAERLAARRAEIGAIAAPRNSGKRRTEVKRALLAEIEKLGGEW